MKLALEPFNIFLTGNGSTGKSFIAKHIHDPNAVFDENYKSDLCHEVAATLESNIGPLVVNFYVISGQSKTSTLLHQVLRNHNQGGMAVYSWDQKNSLANLPDRIGEVHRAFPGIPIVIVGNKGDLPEHGEGPDVRHKALVGKRLKEYMNKRAMKELKKNHTWCDTSVKKDPHGLKVPLQGLLREILRRRDVPNADSMADSLVLL